MALTCNKCKKEITRKDFIACTGCQNYYHLDCTSIGEKLFYLKSVENRKKCQCDACRFKVPSDVEVQINISTNNSFESLEVGSIPELPQDEENFVTTRRNKKQASLHDLSESYFSLNDTPVRTKSYSSLLDENICENLEMNELKLEIKRLKVELDIANNEIHKLTVVNTELLKKNKDQGKVIKLFKTVDVDEIEICSTKNKTNRPVIRKSTPLKKSARKNETRRHISLDPRNNYNECSSITNDTLKTIPKLCLISSFNQNKISQKVRNHFTEEHDCCHYRVPGGDILQLSRGLQEKLEHFTLNDYCIIIIGETDFTVSKNYKELVNTLKQRIMSVQHTNVILCLPTYKHSFNSNIFNNRVKIFNDLLYRDNTLHQYCFLLDSNKHLQYSYNMFSRYSGKINIRGIQIILNDLDNLIIAIAKETFQNTICLNQNENTSETVANPA